MKGTNVDVPVDTGQVVKNQTPQLLKINVLVNTKLLKPQD
jgi:hypothetical protein